MNTQDPKKAIYIYMYVYIYICTCIYVGDEEIPLVDHIVRQTECLHVYTYMYIDIYMYVYSYLYPSR
jgi:hypothetical protein